MAAQQFNLVTDWVLASPLERVWDELMRPDEWPAWWRAVKNVVLLQEGDARGVGAERRFTWGTALPYQLTFDMRAVRVEPMALIEGRASGELDGTGRWTLRADGPSTRVRYEWDIELSKPWMRSFAPLLRPAFAWNHNVVMGWGYDDIQKRLGITR